MLNIAQNVGWSTFELIIIATAAAALSKHLFGFSGKWLWTIAFGVLSWGLGMLGPIGFVRRYLRKFAAWASPDMNVTVLVDFENDSVRTALEVADALGDRLWGVRIDTSDKLVDRSLWADMGYFKPTGVNIPLVTRVREALDAAGYERVKIVVSGGFDAKRIREFESLGAPVDSYGVGSSLLRGSNDYTADVVLVNGRECAKVGRRWRPNPRLERVR